MAETKVKPFNENNNKRSTVVPEDEPIKRKPGKYQKLLKEFSQESSAGGINKIFSSKPILIRSIWVLLCLVCYSAMIYLSFSAVKTYFTNPTSTFIDVSFETDLPFPAITIYILETVIEEAIVAGWEYSAKL
ncbi:degenerin mec-10-like isoform X3, partial [Paramuricea clavata]